MSIGRVPEVLFALLLLSDIVRPRGLDETLHALPAAVIVIGLGSFVLLRWWMIAGIALVGAGWFASVAGSAPPSRLGHLAFTLVAGLTVAVPMHFARRRSLRRIVQLRRQDAARQAELQRALAEAEETRRTAASCKSDGGLQR